MSEQQPVTGPEGAPVAGGPQPGDPAGASATVPGATGGAGGKADAGAARPGAGDGPRGRRVDPLKPGARAIQGLRAGVVTRTAAGAIDYVLVAVLTVGTYAAIAVVLFLVNPIDYQLPSWPFLYFLALGFGYLVVYLWLAFATNGRTVGAGIMGVRVVGLRGGRMHLIPALLRALFVAAFPIGLFWCALSRENRSLQDMVMRTSVIHDWPVPKEQVDIQDVDLKRLG